MQCNETGDPRLVTRTAEMVNRPVEKTLAGAGSAAAAGPAAGRRPNRPSRGYRGAWGGSRRRRFRPSGIFPPRFLAFRSRASPTARFHSGPAGGVR